MPEPRIEDRPIEPDARSTEAAPTARPANRPVAWGVSGVVIGVFLVLDFITPQLSGPADWRVAVMLGICMGQVNLIAVWAVLAPGNIVVRLPWSLLLTMAMWYALVLGGRDAQFIAVEDAIGLGAVLLAGVVIAQVPLWIARKVFRWRLIRGADDAVQSPPGPWQFNLQHLLLATFLLAVALAPLRQVLPAQQIGHLHVEGILLEILGVVMLCSLLITVPCVWGMMVSRLASVAIALGWLVYCGFLTGVEIGSVRAIFGARFGPPDQSAGEMFLVALVMNVCQGATVFVTLLIYRALGFRLVRARPPGKSP